MVGKGDGFKYLEIKIYIEHFLFFQLLLSLLTYPEYTGPRVAENCTRSWRGGHRWEEEGLRGCQASAEVTSRVFFSFHHTVSHQPDRETSAQSVFQKRLGPWWPLEDHLWQKWEKAVGDSYWQVWRVTWERYRACINTSFCAAAQVTVAQENDVKILKELDNLPYENNKKLKKHCILKQSYDTLNEFPSHYPKEFVANNNAA